MGCHRRQPVGGGHPSISERFPRLCWLFLICRGGPAARLAKEAGGPPRVSCLELRWVPARALDGLRELRAKRCCPSRSAALVFIASASIWRSGLMGRFECMPVDSRWWTRIYRKYRQFGSRTRSETARAVDPKTGPLAAGLKVRRSQDILLCIARRHRQGSALTTSTAGAV